MNILMIGLDATTSNDRKKLVAKLETYNHYTDRHFNITYILLRNHERFVIKNDTGSVTVIGTGGTNKIMTFFYAIIEVIRLVHRGQRTGNPIDRITTQDVLYTGLLGYFAQRYAVLYRTLSSYGPKQNDTHQKIPLIVQIHGDYVDNPLWLKQARVRCIENRIARWILRRADKVRAVSSRIIRDIQKYTKKHAKIVSLPIGTDIKKFEIDDGSTEHKQEHHKTLLFVGRLIEEKNPMLFCEIAKVFCEKHSDIIIEFAGTGDMEQQIRQYFVDNQLIERVVFLGQCTPQQLGRAYRRALCYVHTALWEGWGLPMIESMACGCPIVTTNTGCAEEAVRNNEHGYIVDAQVDSFVCAIDTLYNNPEQARQMGENGTIEAQKWSSEVLTKRFAVLLLEE